ncbi:hypothetical protein TYRP_014439, partial [Tyrophagus putrescentiae]
SFFIHHLTTGNVSNSGLRHTTTCRFSVFEIYITFSFLIRDTHDMQNMKIRNYFSQQENVSFWLHSNLGCLLAARWEFELWNFLVGTRRVPSLNDEPPHCQWTILRSVTQVMRVDENERYEMTDGPNERAYHEARRLSADRNQPRLARLVVSTVGWAVSYVF